MGELSEKHGWYKWSALSTLFYVVWQSTLPSMFCISMAEYSVHNTPCPRKKASMFGVGVFNLYFLRSVLKSSGHADFKTDLTFWIRSSTTWENKWRVKTPTPNTDVFFHGHGVCIMRYKDEQMGSHSVLNIICLYQSRLWWLFIFTLATKAAKHDHWPSIKLTKSLSRNH